MPGCSRDGCDAQGDSRCPVCRVATYCSKACLKADRKPHKRVCASLANAAAAPAPAPGPAPAPAAGASTAEEERVCVGPKLAPFNPTGGPAVDAAIELLQLTPEDVVYELGCGDARFLVAASQASGCSGVGVEYDELYADRARAAVEAAGLQDRLSIVHGDATVQDLGPATAMFVYLVPAGIRQVRPLLEAALARGVRIATNIFSLPWLEPDEVRTYKATNIYLYSSSSAPKAS